MAIEELQNGRYRRVRLLGSGGMGEVYLMQDIRVNRQVAIKVIRSEGAPYPGSDTARDAARLFQREARAIAALEHPNILPLYDFGEETLEGVTLSYMVMPFCPEGTLTGWLQQHGSAPMLSPQDVAHMVEQAAEALQYAHDHHVIHLDIKPSNFLIRSNKKTPNRPTLLLADFGVARLSAATSNASQAVRGTPTSMAPEQWSSVPVPATDQYALAVMAYGLLVGRPPFLGGMEQLMYQHFHVQPPPPSTFNPRLSSSIDAVLLRALAKNSADRFPSISAFAGAFEQAVQRSPTEPVSGPQQPSASDFQATLAISQAEALSGTSRAITLPGGQRVDVAIPAGTYDGQVIRLQVFDEPSSPEGMLALTIAVKRPQEDLLPFDPVSDHDLPTVVTSDANLQAPQRQQLPPLPKRQPAPRTRMVGILSGLIILLLIAGSIVYFYSGRQSNSQQTNATATAKSGQTATHTPTVTITSTATSQNGLYIAGTYNGSMFNQTTQQTTDISVLIVQTQGSGILSGTFTLTSPSQGAYPLSGTVDTQGNFSFTVQQSAGQTPLYLYGAVYKSVYLKGNFCNSNTNSCSANTGYFTVGPRF